MLSITAANNVPGASRKNSIKEYKSSRLTQIRRLFAVGWIITLLSGHYLFDFCLAFIKTIKFNMVDRKHPTSTVGCFSFALKIVIHRRLSILSRAHHSGSSSVQGHKNLEKAL